MARVLHFGQVIIDFTLLIDALPESGGDVFAFLTQAFTRAAAITCCTRPNRWVRMLCMPAL